MPARTIETDYLVVGCGAAGMAFADALIADCEADVVMVDRRHAPGGHWNDAYPFVRLHQPSAYYGVNSLPLGSDAVEAHGPERGLCERASGPEICAYYDRAMRHRLLPSGRVRYFPMFEHAGRQRLVSRASGEEYEVRIRKKLVDARYLEPSIPATSRLPFELEEGARCVPINALPRMEGRADRYAIIGAGKTAVDACLWLLEIGVPPEDIRWIKPRDSWYLNRVFAQSGELVGNLLEGLSLQVEAAAQASSIEDLMLRLGAAGQLLRLDEEVAPAMYKGATASAWELEQLRRIRDVVRLGRVRRIERDAIVLDGGAIPTSPRTLHVACTAPGLNLAPAVPIFGADRITLQPIRMGLIPFNAALVGFVEATRGEADEKNRLCPPNRLPDVPLDWARGTLVGMQADYLWSKDPALAGWLDSARLNPARGIRRRAGDPQVQRASARYAQHARPAIARLQQLVA